MAELSKSPDEKKSTADAFTSEAELAQAGLLAEFWEYLRQNKKWWLTPIMVVLLMVGALVIFGGTAAAPFIYTLF